MRVKKTAEYNLRKKRSLLIFVGGEREQLLTAENSHKIYLKHRKGFVSLALSHGVPIVPCYCFGENEVYHTSDFFLEYRLWLQKKTKIALTIIWGRFWYAPWFPVKVKMGIELGKPIEIKKLDKDAITAKDVDDLHDKFVLEMTRLFERTKHKYGVPKDVTLQID